MDWVVDSQAQESAVIREIEDLKQRWRKEVDAMVKAYTDMVQYEKRFTPDGAAEILTQNSVEFTNRVDKVLKEIGTDISAYTADKVSSFKQGFEVAEEAPAK